MVLIPSLWSLVQMKTSRPTLQHHQAALHDYRGNTFSIKHLYPGDNKEKPGKVLLGIVLRTEEQLSLLWAQRQARKREGGCMGTGLGRLDIKTDVVGRRPERASDHRA